MDGLDFFISLLLFSASAFVLTFLIIFIIDFPASQRMTEARIECVKKNGSDGRIYCSHQE